MNPKKTGEFILQKRKNKNITQQELAELLNVTNKAISRWETGEGYPDISLLPQLAVLLNCTVDEILAGESKEDEINKKKQIPLFSYTLIFSISIIFMLILGVTIAYATFYEWIGLLLLSITILGSLTGYIILRQKYLSECEYNNRDKALLFKNTAIMYCSILISLFIYIPLIIFDPNLISSEPVSTKAILSFMVGDNNYCMIAFIFGIISIFICGLIIAIHYHKLFKIKNLKNKVIFITSEIIIAIIMFISNDNSIAATILMCLSIVGLITLLILHLTKKIKVIIPLYITLITIFIYFTMYFVLADIYINNIYPKYEDTNTNLIIWSIIMALISLVYLVPIITSIIFIIKNKDKTINKYILISNIVMLLITWFNALLSQSFVY